MILKHDWWEKRLQIHYGAFLGSILKKFHNVIVYIPVSLNRRQVHCLERQTALIYFLWQEIIITDPHVPWSALSFLNPVLPRGNSCLISVWFQGKEMSIRKSHVTLDAPIDHVPLHVRGGHIIPTQEPAINTALRYFTSSSTLTSNQTLPTSSQG